MNFLASLIAYCLPKRVQYWAMLEYMDKAPIEMFMVEEKKLNYTFRIEKVTK